MEAVYRALVAALFEVIPSGKVLVFDDYDGTPFYRVRNLGERVEFYHEDKTSGALRRKGADIEALEYKDGAEEVVGGVRYRDDRIEVYGTFQGKEEVTATVRIEDDTGVPPTQVPKPANSAQ